MTDSADRLVPAVPNLSDETWCQIAARDPAFARAYQGLSDVPLRAGTLEPKVRELVLLALDASTTHLHGEGVGEHLRAALGHGASEAEVMEVLELCSVLGIHSCNIGVPILLEELAAAGQEVSVPADDWPPRERALKDEFIRVRGYWSELWDGVLALDPDFFEAYFRFSAVPFQNGTLAPKVREFIYTAIDAATTHLYVPGLRIHIRNAIAHGATAAELMEVLELTALQGIHTCALGVPALVDASAGEQDRRALQ